jgi:hypothetical protein
MGVPILMSAANPTFTPRRHGHVESWHLSYVGQVGAWVELIGDHWTVHAAGDNSVVRMEGANAGGVEGAPLLDGDGMQLSLRTGEIARISSGTVFVRPILDEGEPVDVHLYMRMTK